MPEKANDSANSENRFHFYERKSALFLMAEFHCSFNFALQPFPYIPTWHEIFTWVHTACILAADGCVLLMNWTQGSYTESRAFSTIFYCGGQKGTFYVCCFS